jgi:hypothetical protein
MRLKRTLKQAALAIAVGACLPAMAGINNENAAELYLVVWDEEVGSYALDTGLTIDDILAGSANPAGYSFSRSVGPAYAQFVAADLDPNDLSASGGTGTRWALFATDGEGFADPGDFRYLTTSFMDATPKIDNLTFNTVLGRKSLYAITVNQTGTHTPDFAINGESFNPKGDAAAYIETTYFATAGVFGGNAVNTPAALWFVTTASYEPFDSALIERLNGSVSFDGQQVSFNVAAIPEPGTYAMLLAGLGAVGFIARRRQRGGQ